MLDVSAGGSAGGPAWELASASTAVLSRAARLTTLPRFTSAWGSSDTALGTLRRDHGGGTWIELPSWGVGVTGAPSLRSPCPMPGGCMKYLRNNDREIAAAGRARCRLPGEAVHRIAFGQRRGGANTVAQLSEHRAAEGTGSGRELRRRLRGQGQSRGERCWLSEGQHCGCVDTLRHGLGGEGWQVRRAGAQSPEAGLDRHTWRGRAWARAERWAPGAGAALPGPSLCAGGWG